MLLHSCCVVVPKSLQKEAIRKIHQGDLGIQKCQLRANAPLWWLDITKQTSEAVKTCQKCAKNAPPPIQPLISSPLPLYSWQKVTSDLFHFKGKSYLLCVDYFSRHNAQQYYLQGSENSFKNIFARHGIPETLLSNSGPQYLSHDIKEFASTYGFVHTTSNSHYSRSNGLAERTVKTIKNPMNKSAYLNSLLPYSTFFMRGFKSCDSPPL